MWASPRLLHAAAGFLVGIAALAACFAAMQLFLRSERFPLRQIEIKAELKQTTKAEIEAALRGRGSGNFFAADIGELRAALERLPWLRRVAVRRLWPGRLEVSLEEHVVLAHWGDEALVNTYGERFLGKTNAILPVFLAPSGTEAEVARRYLRFAALVAPLGTRVERVVLTPRLAWQLRLGNGLHLMLGRDADLAEERLRHFVGVYPMTLEKIPLRHEYVDLRYPNGFALRVPQLKG